MRSRASLVRKQNDEGRLLVTGPIQPYEGNDSSHHSDGVTKHVSRWRLNQTKLPGLEPWGQPRVTIAVHVNYATASNDGCSMVSGDARATQRYRTSGP